MKWPIGQQTCSYRQVPSVYLVSEISKHNQSISFHLYSKVMFVTTTAAAATTTTIAKSQSITTKSVYYIHKRNFCFQRVSAEKGHRQVTHNVHMY
jgi:hypothetical protein